MKKRFYIVYTVFILLFLLGYKLIDLNAGNIIIKFETNGGNEISPISRDLLPHLGGLPTPKKDGHKFNGWYSDKKLTKIYIFTRAQTKKITLYAKWKTDEIAPTFSSLPKNQILAHGAKLDLLKIGLIAIDDVDGDISDRISVDVIDSSSLPLGENEINYTVSDQAGNRASVTIKLFVIPTSEYEKYFTVNSIGDTIIDYDLNGGRAIVIPQFINGILITTIGERAFDHKSLINVVIPDGVTSIGDYAFEENELISVTIPDSVTTIGEGAFSYNFIKSLMIPNSVTDIKSSAFYHNRLTSIEIPNSVTSLGGSTFGDNLLTEVTIPNSITKLSDRTFTRNQLTTVTIPDSVTSIGYGVFSNNKLTTLTIPNSVTTIGKSAFEDNKLTNVIIPNSVTTLGERAFARNSLKSLTLSNSLVEIKSNVFEDNQLTTLTIPNGVTKIGSGAFRSNKLITVIIPESVAVLDYDAFSYNSLISVKIYGDRTRFNSTWSEIGFQNILKP